MSEQNNSRREFLKAAAIGAGAVAAPWIWVPRRAFAATTDFHKSAKHILVLYADGGMRSPSLFNADKIRQWNPHVDGQGNPTQPSAPGTEWDLGAVADAAPLRMNSWDDNLPPLPAVTGDITVLGTVDHEPHKEQSDANHQSAKLRMTTGYPDGTTGFLAQISKHHGLYAGEGRFTAFPPVSIGGGARIFGLAGGDNFKFRSLFFNGPEDFDRGGPRSFHIPAPSWAEGFAARQDERYTARVSPADLQRVGLYLDSKKNMGRFRDILAAPMLNILRDGNVAAELGTNAQLRDAFGAGPWGPRVALAIRMFQLGSPAVAVAVGGYDTHSNEMLDFPPLARDLGRQLAALRYVLPRLQHPDGGTYWDHTLVTVVSEFARDNTERSTGYNSAQGSDHRGLNGSRFQAVPFMGGPIAGAKLYGATDRETMAAKDEVFASQGVLAMLSDAVGVDPGLFLDEPAITRAYGG